MSTSRYAILTVTSDKSLLDSLRDLLDAGQQFRDAVGQEEAITKARSGESGLILLDVRQPKLDLPGFLQALRREPTTSDIPILLLVSSEKEALPGLEQGANDYLVHPFNAPIARSRIRNLLDLGRCIEALRRFSLVDGASGIANRVRFDEFLSLEWRRNLRNRTPLSIVLMELDSPGTPMQWLHTIAGEEDFRRIAGALEQATQRPGDLVACYKPGGLACVLPETDTLGAVSVAEHMRAELATLGIFRDASGTPLTMSVGSATKIPDGNLEPEELVALAESNLEEAKQSGGNRVMFGR